MIPSRTRLYIVACFFSVLIFCGCEVDMESLIHFRTKHGDTLLHAAVKSRRSGALYTFLELGCPTEAVDREGRTPLWLATENGEVELMKILAKYGADLKLRYGEFNETLIHVAAKNGRDLSLYWLLEVGFSTEARDRSGWTPLHGASSYGHPTTIRLLVARGADVNASDAAGETPLHKAVRIGKASVVGRLLELGADVNATDASGETPLAKAERFRFKKVVDLLRGRSAEAETESERRD